MNYLRINLTEQLHLFINEALLRVCATMLHTRQPKLSGHGNLIRASTPLLSMEQYRKQQRTKSSLEKFSGLFVQLH